jgi:hypothetical protein
MLAGDVIIHHYGSASFNKQDPLKLQELIGLNIIKFYIKWGVTPPPIYIKQLRRRGRFFV